MANTNPQAPGQPRDSSKLVQRVDVNAQIGTTLPQIPRETGEVFTAAGNLFRSLAAEIGSFADDAAKREGQDAGTAAAKAAFEQATPLALRHDGTIRGEAFDKAALEATTWRWNAKLRNDIGDAYNAHKDDPQAFQAALADIKAKATEGAVFADPKLREVFDKNFSDVTLAYTRSVATRAQERVDGEKTAATDDALASERIDLERRAYLGGADPVTAQTLETDVKRARGNIDKAVQDGTITPEEGQKRKKALTDDIVVSRIRGAFDAISSPNDKQKFADGITKRWGEGDPALGSLDRAKAEALQAHLHGQARQAVSSDRLEVALNQKVLEHQLGDDIASIRRSGVPTDGAVNRDDAHVAGVLGPAKAYEWAAKRKEAQDYWVAAGDLAKLSAADMADRVASLKPVDGAPDFAAKAKLFDQVSQEAQRILKLRASDPAKAVDDAAPGLQDLKGQLDPAKPASFEKLALTRLSVQSALGIPGALRQPLTNDEARAIMAPVTKAVPGQEGAAWNAMADDLAKRYGAATPEVLRQLLQVRGVDRATAETGAAFLSRLQRGEATRNDGKAADVASEASRGDKAMAPAAAPTLARPVPGRAIDMLKADPSLKGLFDEKYGKGAADLYLGGGGGTTTIAPNGTEGWQP